MPPHRNPSNRGLTGDRLSYPSADPNTIPFGEPMAILENLQIPLEYQHANNESRQVRLVEWLLRGHSVSRRAGLTSQEARAQYYVNLCKEYVGHNVAYVSNNFTLGKVKAVVPVTHRRKNCDMQVVIVAPSRDVKILILSAIKLVD